MLNFLKTRFSVLHCLQKRLKRTQSILIQGENGDFGGKKHKLNVRWQLGTTNEHATTQATSARVADVEAAGIGGSYQNQQRPAQCAFHEYDRDDETRAHCSEFDGCICERECSKSVCDASDNGNDDGCNNDDNGCNDCLLGYNGGDVCGILVEHDVPM
jgi:hypothetical protein